MRDNQSKRNEQSSETEINELLASFFKQHLNNDYFNYAAKLYERIEKSKKINMNRGKKEVWAASIVFVIARLNFLFDKANENFITPDTICEFFNTKKSTVSNKASLIADTFDLFYGEEGMSDPKIADSFSFIQLENGLIIPKGMAKNTVFKIGIASEEESKEIERFEEEQRRKREQEALEKKQKREEIKRQKAEEKQKEEERIQPSLFDL